MTDLIESFRKHYASIHPLVFSRSVERSHSPGDLSDILSSIPEARPIIWDEDLRRWVVTEDMLQSQGGQLHED